MKPVAIHAQARPISDPLCHSDRPQGEHTGEVARGRLSTTEQSRLCATRRKPRGSKMVGALGSRPLIRIAPRSVEGARQQSLVSVADDPVAFARHRLELRAVEHGSRAAGAGDQPRVLQFADHAG
jgi:hypothetical protein